MTACASAAASPLIVNPGSAIENARNVCSYDGRCSDCATDAKAVLDPIRRGHVYSVVDALASPAVLSFTATTPSATAVAGDAMPLAGEVTLRVNVQGTADARIELLKDGTQIAMGKGAGLEHVAGEAGVYRVEVFLPGAPGTPPVPWILSNPIYVGRSVTDTPAADPRLLIAHAYASVVSGMNRNPRNGQNADS